MTQQENTPSINRDQTSLRAAVPDDAETIHRLISGLAGYVDAEHKLKSVPDDFRRHLSGNPPSFYGLIAEYEGEAVGLSLFFPSFSSWRGARGVYIQDLYVAPETRASGLGKRILIEVLRTAHEQWGAEYLRLAVDENNLGAQRFYERIGMHWTSDERIFQIDEVDLLSLMDSD
ncbi:MAG: GNAT family N-acetyltransferase [Rhodospirillales bacterium]|nr:GNAT family N-acetyltransferase [Rhodospirillales bacterium]